MLLALVVLIGFGTLFMLAFDEGSTSGKSIEARIRDAEKTIASRNSSIEASQRRLDTIPALKKTSAELLEATTKNNFLGLRIEKRTEEINEIKADMLRIEDDLADYKNQYRAYVRNAAEGTKIDEIKTLSGEVYTEVDIRKVTAVGIEIRHRDGHKRIGFEELPEEMQDYYQFDKNQMLAEVQREIEVRKAHNAAVAVSDSAMEVKAAKQRAKDDAEAKQKVKAEIAEKEARLVAINQDIQNLQNQLMSAESAAQAARASGRMHLSKSGTINNRIASKRNEYSRVQSDIATLKASL